jgi:hypothetical protein
MPMTPFMHRFPELGTQETRTLTVAGRTDLPDDEYGLLELYCDERGCDCRRVVVEVIARRTGRTLALINYGWDSVDFYAKNLHSREYAREVVAASLDPMNPQSEYAPVLLELFREVVKDPAYRQRLARHYQMFKMTLRKAGR